MHVVSVPERLRGSRRGARLYFRGSADTHDRAHFGRVRECARRRASEPPARRGRKGIPNASGAEPGHPLRAAESAPRPPAPRLVPRRAEEGPERWRLSGPSYPTSKRGIKSNREKEPTTFLQRETKPKRVPVPLPSAPGATRQFLAFRFPSRPANKHTNNKPQSCLARARAPVRIHMSTHRFSAPPPALGCTKPRYPDPRLAPSAPADRAAPHLSPGLCPGEEGLGGSCAQADSRAPLLADPSGRRGRRRPQQQEGNRDKPRGRVAVASAPPRPLQPLRAPARGARWAVRPSPGPHSPRPSWEVQGGCAWLLGGVPESRRGVAGELLLSVSRRQRLHSPAVRSTRSHRPQLLSAARLANHHRLRRLRRVPRQRRAPSPARPRRLSIFSAGGRARLPAHSCPPFLPPPALSPGSPPAARPDRARERSSPHPPAPPLPSPALPPALRSGLRLTSSCCWLQRPRLTG